MKKNTAQYNRKPENYAHTNPESEWFGFERVAKTEKAQRVRGVFDSVAKNYDLMNDLMSGGLHRVWKDIFVKQIRPRAGEAILDLAGGTGDIAFRMHKASDGQAAITLCDYNAEMLNVGRNRMFDFGICNGLEWVTGDAAVLPFEDASFDKVCISFGLRNVARIDDALAEINRVLKPTGRFFCMEFSPGVSPMLKNAYNTYSHKILPLMGQLVARDRAAYQYLAESISQFPDQASLAARMEQAGLQRVKWENLAGGIVAIHSGWRY